MSKLVLIDGNAILHRAYHALPFLMTRKGEPINAVYGFISILLKVTQDLKPTHIAVCFDRSEPTFRKKEFKAYQAQRPVMDKELSGQIEKAHRVVDAFGIPMYDMAGFEADDLIGTLALQATENVKDQSQKKTSALSIKPNLDEVVIVTGDRDLLQLVNDKVKVFLPAKGLSEAKLFGTKEVIEKMGVSPESIPDYKALVGDPSDNYKGVSGIGPKTAINLITKYGSVEAVYKSLKEIPASTKEKLVKDKGSAELSHRLATIVKNVPIEIDFEKMDNWSVDNPNVLNLFKEYGFKTLTKRVKEVGKKMQQEKQGSLF
jgi:DNA polymerase-1